MVDEKSREIGGYTRGYSDIQKNALIERSKNTRGACDDPGMDS